MKKNMLLIMLVMISLAIGCDKSDSNDKAVLEVRLTDAPADYGQVLIDIQEVQIHSSADENNGEWVSLDINEGVYNLLDFTNGMDTLLGIIELPAGTVSQMRLVLGDNNQIKVNDVLYDLQTPSAQQSGLKFNIHAALTAGLVYKLWIDFDAARSIVENGNGDYILKPVIRTYTEAVSGAISGVVSPAEAMPYIKAVTNNDTIGTYAGTDGEFLIKGVPEGSWKVMFEPADPYNVDTVYGVAVENGAVTVMDTLYFE